MCSVLAMEHIPQPLDVAIKRNAQRSGFARVPDSAIKNMKRGFSIPAEKEFPKTKWGFSDIKVNVHH